MRIVQINISCGSGSTGKICEGISKELTQNGTENYVLYNSGSSKLPDSVKYTDSRRIKTAALESRIKGNWGFEGKASTKSLLKELDRLKPDVVHLHNLHSHACNIEMLFRWLRENNVKVFWTFHDCWAFTGYCMHYDMIGCDRWKSECNSCPQKKSYSWIFDRSRELFLKKKQITSGMDLTIVAPSKWIAEQAKQSFFGAYPVKVIYNGIDLSVFKPYESDFRERYSIGSKRLVMGAAIGWGERKGLDVFIELSKRLNDDYKIVLVGTDERTDELLPKNIISIHRTENQTELAKIYSAADVFFNPTREEVLGLTNIEALACATPVVTFDSGGSPETIDPACGAVVDKNDIDSAIREIKRICETRPFSKEACLKRASRFDGKEKFSEYAELYN